ncbi:U1 snRNP protein [Cladophialophora chaetospira]|uniref:U1 snRNP protein n=1 Tax=Cladophialophora chaetospira TaxID=386627 RepID=A0AA38WW02_9EURO|nr:U1 snRNP protein [Cladophialophora chaetospira]
MNGLPPTPSLWREARAPDGRTYFYHATTKETKWTKPEELMTPLEKALANQPWKEHTTPEGRKYYSNTETKQTVWDMPQQYRDAVNSLSLPPKALPQPPAFVAGGSTALQSYREREDHTPFERPRTENGIAVPAITKEVVPDYSSFEEAEAAFMKLLRRSNVQPEWNWEQAMRATIKDPQYRALKDPKDRKAAFEKYAVEVRQQEREKAKERLAKLRTDFGNMLRTHPEIKHYSRWKTIRPIIQGETVFRSTDNEDERKQLFEEYIVELKKQHVEQEASSRRSALDDLAAILKALNLEPYTRWSQAQEIVQSNERMLSDEKFKLLSKSDILTAFENHIKSLERTFNDARQQQKATKTRRERQNRDRFMDLLQSLRSQGKIKAGTKWMTLLPEIENDPRYVAVLGQAGSTPLDLFWDIVEEEERALRGRRNDVYDVLEDKRYEVTPRTSFDEFLNVMHTDRKTATIDRDVLRLIFQRLHEKVVRRSEDEKHAADRHQRRAVDALRSRIKHLDPPVRITDSWDDVKPRVEKTDEFRALDDEELKKSAYDKVIKRLKEKEEDAEKDRDRRHSRRTDDRDYRNGHREAKYGRLSKSPEPDAYEEDRRKAQAAREKQYRKTSGFSPPPSQRDPHRGERDERHGRLVRDRSPAPRHVSGYDRERRDRESERERLYRTRADPRSTRDELNYGEESKSVAGSDRRRRRDGSEDSVESGRRSAKRHRRDRKSRSRERIKTKTPEPSTAKKEIPAEVVEPAGVHSGSEEGEIEED